MKIILDENESRAKIISALAYAEILIKNKANDWKESFEDSVTPIAVKDSYKGFYESDLEYAAIIDKILNNI